MPSLPSAILPGMRQYVSHIESPRPSASVAPSIWYLQSVSHILHSTGKTHAAVAKPQMKSRGRAAMEVRLRTIAEIRKHLGQSWQHQVLRKAHCEVTRLRECLRARGVHLLDFMGYRPRPKGSIRGCILGGSAPRSGLDCAGPLRPLL